MGFILFEKREVERSETGELNAGEGMSPRPGRDKQRTSVDQMETWVYVGLY